MELEQAIEVAQRKAGTVRSERDKLVVRIKEIA